MTDFDTTWGNADPDATGGEDDLTPPMDGFYDVALIDASAYVSKAGDPWVKLKWQVVSHVQQSYQWGVLLGFKSQAQANLTKRAVRDLGVDVDQVVGLEALDTELKTKVGGYYTVEVKTSQGKNGGEFRNTYLQDTRPAAPDLPAPEPVAAVVEATDDGDVPW